jgi:uncharacterized protein YggT (Ycf19 family)
MEDIKVADDDARQSRQLEAVKTKVRNDVGAEIEGQASRAAHGGEARVAEVAVKLRDQAVEEPLKSERVLGQARAAARGSQFIDYAFYMVYSLLGIRLGLALIGARTSNGFVQLIQTVSDPFFAPFRDIVPSPTAEGGFTLVVPILVALVVYLILHAAINGLLRMVGKRKTAI